MESKIAQAIQMKYLPVAVVLTNEKPEGALEFLEGKRGCVPAMLNGAAKGKTAVFSRKTFGCPGGGTGIGFGDTYKGLGGMADYFVIEHFLSNGNKEFCESEAGQNLFKQVPQLKYFLEEGESYLKTPDIARNFIKSLPMTNIPFEYVVYKPLQKLSDGEIPKIVVFLANPDQLSALVVLANYARESQDRDNVIVRFGAGCHQTGIIAYQECLSENPRAVIGLTDISVRKIFDKDILSFSVPYAMFLEMESNVEGSFLQKADWLKVLERNR